MKLETLISLRPNTNKLVRVVFQTISIGQKLDLEIIGRLRTNDTKIKQLVIEGAGQYSKTTQLLEYDQIISFNYL